MTTLSPSDMGSSSSRGVPVYSPAVAREGWPGWVYVDCVQWLCWWRPKTSPLSQTASMDVNSPFRSRFLCAFYVVNEGYSMGLDLMLILWWIRIRWELELNCFNYSNIIAGPHYILQKVDPHCHVIIWVMLWVFVLRRLTPSLRSSSLRRGPSPLIWFPQWPPLNCDVTTEWSVDLSSFVLALFRCKKKVFNY